MFYQIDTDGLENTYMGKEQGLNSHVSLISGKELDIKQESIDLPYRFTMTVTEGEEPDYYAWYKGSNLMQKKFVEILKKAGVKNIQTFPAEIKREDNGDLVPGYTVVNIIDPVSCADLEKSDTLPIIAETVYFKKLVIDPKKTKGKLFFMVEESPMAVLADETLVKVIKEENLKGLVFEPVEEVKP